MKLFLPLTAAVSLLGITTLLHLVVQKNLVSLLPLPLLLSITLVWSLAAPGYYLIALAVASELLGELPPGLATVLVVIPALLYRLRRQIEVDVSFSFAAILFFTVFCQLVVLSTPHLWQFYLASTSWSQVLSALPWQLLGSMLILNTAAAWGLTLICVSLLPTGHQSSSPFDHQYYGSPRH